tara:strand:- start:1735 stop:2109 length:375 start_codon:yes stop_codon:yes gene_type:complete
LKYKNYPKTLTYIIAAIWGINGLVCKILNVVPRHEEIVERILGIGHARLFSGPLPFIFTYIEKKKEVLIIEGVRQHWKLKPIHLINVKVGFVKNKGFKNIHLSNAFEVSDIPYYWKKRKREQWT